MEPVAEVDPVEAAARDARRRGDTLKCYDLAMRALAEKPRNHAFTYLACLALADLGNVEHAVELYEAHDAATQPADQDWLALRGRLFKEFAFRGGEDAQEQFRRSAKAYEAACARLTDTYAAINAAAMYLLAGDSAPARETAARVLSLLPVTPPTRDADAYYHFATRAEAALILGQVGEARDALFHADRYLPHDATVRSRTLRQLRAICAANGLEEQRILAPLSLPRFVCALPQGTPPSQDNGEPATEGGLIGTAFVVMGTRADLELAEELQARRIPLHLVLPGGRDRASQRLGEDSPPRLDRLIALAQDVSPVTGFLEAEQDVAIAHAHRVAQGLLRLRSRSSGAATVATSGRREVRAEEKARQASAWDRVGADAPRRQMAALIFADFAGFSRLPDTDLPAFWNVLMPAIAQALAPHSRTILLQQTWGDALYLVLDAARPAALAALDILETLNRVRSQLSGGLSSIKLRLSIHFAPVFSGWDPIGLNKLYYGSHVSLAARIEPVTPPGTIYVSEALAAQLALEGLEGFELTYAGEVDLAKGYGRTRAFHLRAARALTADAEGRVSGASLASVDEVAIGVTGSLLLTPAQAGWVREQLVETVLPDLQVRLGVRPLRFASGLAPGADLLFVESARDWALAKGVSYRIQSVLPVPAETLLADWNERASQASVAEVERETRANWRRMCEVLMESASVISLWPTDADTVDLAVRSFRQKQYRQLGAYLLNHTQVLIAIYNRQAAGGPGGTAEVVRWWKDPSAMPAPFGAPKPRPGMRLLATLDPFNREVLVEALERDPSAVE